MRFCQTRVGGGGRLRAAGTSGPVTTELQWVAGAFCSSQQLGSGHVGGTGVADALDLDAGDGQRGPWKHGTMEG